MNKRQSKATQARTIRGQSITEGACIHGHGRVTQWAHNISMGHGRVTLGVQNRKSRAEC